MNSSLTNRELRKKIRIPVLMYHEVTTLDKAKGLSRVLQKRYIVTKDVFEGHLQILSRAGYRGISASELLSNSFYIDEKVVCLTFDDGFEGNYLYAFPILKKYGFQATFFLVSSWVGQKNMMTWKQVKEMIASGMEIGSHTRNHLLLSTCSDMAIRDEVEGSMKDIKKNAFFKVKTISYPSGSYSREVNEIVKECGYSAAFCSDFGYAKKTDRNFAVKRILAKSSLNALKRILDPDPGFLISAFIKERLKTMAKFILGRSHYDMLYFKVFRLKLPIEG